MTKKFWKRNKKEDLYIKILLWAHDRQETGFSWQEMKSHFVLNALQESWVRKIFLTASDNDRKFFEHLRNDEKVEPNLHYYSLNEKGMTAAVNYKGLKQAKRSSKYALWFAGLSLLISAWQFVLPVNFNVGHCYIGAMVGDKVSRMNCPNWIKIGKIFYLYWDSSYDVK